MAGRLLPEWSPRRALCLRWPWRDDIWPEQGRKAQQALLECLRRSRTFLQQSNTEVVVQVPEHLREAARQQLPAFVSIQPCVFADIWIRDSGPFYTRGGSTLLAAFNGWEGLDPAFRNDLLGRESLLSYFDLHTNKLPLTLEGGNLHTDGAGTAFYVASGLLTKGRNPGMTHHALARLLKEHFLIDQLIAFENGLLSDETGGHVDNVLTFLDSSTLAVCLPDSSSHPEYHHCQKIWQQLTALRNLAGKAFRLVPVPVPELQLTVAEAATIRPALNSPRREAGMPLCASYCNGIRIHDGYLLPEFGCDEDIIAAQRIRTACPNLTVIPVPARDLLPGGGGWHCASHTVPR